MDFDSLNMECLTFNKENSKEKQMELQEQF